MMMMMMEVYICSLLCFAFVVSRAKNGAVPVPAHVSVPAHSFSLCPFSYLYACPKK